MSTSPYQKRQPILGILGGMGPQASLHVYKECIAAAVEQGATTNDAFPHILLSNLPVPDFIDDRTNEEVALAMVEAEAKRLEAAGADMLIIACNTMHLHIDRFRSAVSIPILSMVDTVVAAVKEGKHSAVGVLGSPTTIQTGLYKKPLNHCGISALIPSEEDQEIVTQCIQQTIAGANNAVHMYALERVVSGLREKGAEAIVLACTELPLILQSSVDGLPLYSSTSILAERAIEEVLPALVVQK